MKRLNIRAITLAALMVFSVLAVATPAAAAGSTDISLSGPTSVNAGQTVTHDIVVDTVNNDVASFNVSVTSSDASAVEISSVSQAIGGTSGTVESVSSGGSSATIRTAGGSTGAADGNSATIATVTLQGVNAGGSSTISVGVNAGPFDTAGSGYTVGSTPDVNISAPSAGKLDVNDNGNPATDIDGDGTYEDVNGDGKKPNIGDVQALINGIDADKIGSSDTRFNFNSDDKSSVNIGDVQALINQI
jgi:hypothetical protein